MDSSTITTIASFISLIISAILAFFYITDRRYVKFSVEKQHIESLLEWHSLVIAVLIELRHAETKKDKTNLLMKLESLIEQGRFFFPNICKDDFGSDKPIAYRGYRNVTLDFLVASYKIHENNIDENLREKTVHLQKLFTSIIFEIVRPPEQLMKIRRLTDKYFIQDISVEDLLEDHDFDITSHMWDKRN